MKFKLIITFIVIISFLISLVAINWSYKSLRLSENVSKPFFDAFGKALENKGTDREYVVSLLEHFGLDKIIDYTGLIIADVNQGGFTGDGYIYAVFQLQDKDDHNVKKNVSEKKWQSLPIDEVTKKSLMGVEIGKIIGKDLFPFFSMDGYYVYKKLEPADGSNFRASIYNNETKRLYVVEDIK